MPVLYTYLASPDRGHIHTLELNGLDLSDIVGDDTLVVDEVPPGDLIFASIRQLILDIIVDNLSEILKNSTSRISVRELDVYTSSGAGNPTPLALKRLCAANAARCPCLHSLHIQ